MPSYACTNLGSVNHIKVLHSRSRLDFSKPREQGCKRFEGNSLRDQATTALIAYGVRRGELVHVHGVPSGLACECYCVACGGLLIARKGRIRIHHFAHAVDASCVGALETVLHRLAKDILAGADRLVIPPYDFLMSRSVRGQRVRSDSVRLAPGGVVRCSAVEIEPRTFKGIVPDIAIYAGASSKDRTKALLVEIAVTHRVDRRKERLIRRVGIPTIEISLDSTDACATREDIAAKVLNDPGCKRWIFHPAQLQAERGFAQKLREARRSQRAVRERIQHARKLPRQPSNQDSKSAKRDSSTTSMKSFLESERIIVSFVASHGRLPSLEESRRIFKRR